MPKHDSAVSPSKIRLMSGTEIPLEMHRARIVQKLSLAPVEDRLKTLQEASNNLYFIRNEDVFLDMLTDSGINAMSDHQLAAMIDTDDAYAGSRTFFELQDTVRELFGMHWFLPTHQGRACEHLLAKTLVHTGDVVPMNYHFTTTKAHIVACGGSVMELVPPEGRMTDSDLPFKGDLDLDTLEKTIAEVGADRIPFVRIEAGTNLIGGQPVSLANMQAVSRICHKHGIRCMLDASLLQDNLYFNKVREPQCADMSVRQIMEAVAACFDIVYFSARKFGAARGGGMVVREKELFDELKTILVLFEGFLTYGGMSVHEMGAINIGLQETMDFDNLSQGPQFIAYMVRELAARGVPVVTPAGGLGCHVDAARFLPHVPADQYRAAALAAAVYIAGGIRTMERGTLSEDRNPDGSEHIASMELVRFALPRRTFSMSHVAYAVDRIAWVYEHRDLIGGLRFVEEPKVLRFFVGRLEPIGDWEEKLAATFAKDFGDSL